MYSLKIGKQVVKITHGQNILFPQTGITKNELINYYLHIAPTMIPYIKNRPITMHRFTKGIEKEGFFQKNVSEYFPRWIKRVTIAKKEDGVVNYAVCNNAATLVYLANQLCITPHIWLSKIDKLNFPDRMIFDLDPSTKHFAPIIFTAKKLKNILEKLGLKTFVMTTGSRGLHIVVALDRKNNFDFVRKFAKDVAAILVNKYPKIVTSEIRKIKRGRKIFIDTYRNSFAQTSVAPYAVRAKKGAPVATPIEWREVNSKLKPDKYTIKNIFKRLGQKDDPWKHINKFPCTLKHARKKLDNILKNLKIV